MTFHLLIPTSVGSSHEPVRVKFGRKVIGNLSSKPQVKGGKLEAGRYILVARNHELVLKNPGLDLNAHFFTNGLQQTIMEVRYGAEVATYQLFEDRIVYSDGPPHPDHLQLARRIAASPGVTEPRGS